MFVAILFLMRAGRALYISNDSKRRAHQVYARDCPVADVRYNWLIFIFIFIWCAFSWVLVQMTSFSSQFIYLFRWITRIRCEWVLFARRKNCGIIVIHLYINNHLDCINWKKKRGKIAENDGKKTEFTRKSGIGNRYTPIIMEHTHTINNRFRCEWNEMVVCGAAQVVIVL